MLTPVERTTYNSPKFSETNVTDSPVYKVLTDKNN